MTESLQTGLYSRDPRGFAQKTIRTKREITAFVPQENNQFTAKFTNYLPIKPIRNRLKKTITNAKHLFTKHTYDI